MDINDDNISAIINSADGRTNNKTFIEILSNPESSVGDIQDVITGKLYQTLGFQRVGQVSFSSFFN